MQTTVFLLQSLHQRQTFLYKDIASLSATPRIFGKKIAKSRLNGTSLSYALIHQSTGPPVESVPTSIDILSSIKHLTFAVIIAGLALI